QALRGILPRAVVGQRALAAELAARDRVFGVTEHAMTPLRTHFDEHATSVVAVTRAIGADDGVHGRSPAGWSSGMTTHSAAARQRRCRRMGLTYCPVSGK